MTVSPGWFVRFCCFGLLCGSVALAFFAGCGDPAPVTADKSKFQVAGEDDKEPAKEGTANAKGSTENEGFPTAKAEPRSKKPSPRSGSKPGAEEPAKTSEPPEVAEDTKDYGASPQYPLPPGGPQDVFDFLKNLTEKKPKGRTKKETEADYLAIEDSKLAAARKMLTYPRISDETKVTLLQMMLSIHEGFVKNKVPGAEERRDAFAKELSSSKDSMVAEAGRMLEFDVTLGKLATQDPPPADGKEVVAAIEEYIKTAEGSPVPFLVAAHHCESLQHMKGATAQFQKDLILEIRKLAEANKESPVKQVSALAAKILEESGIDEAMVEIKALFAETGEGQEGSEEKLLAGVKELLAKEKPSKFLFSTLRTQMYLLEVKYGKYATTVKLYEMLDASFKGDDDKELVEYAAESVELARKRVALIGKPLVIEGVTIEGKPFDFSPYKGKYVLVDFWATWCDPCLEELPNVRANYDAYHAKGFEVIGLNLDGELEQLTAFLALQGPPWQTVISQELFEKKKVDDPMSGPATVNNGVQSLPFVVLLDKEGKVDSLHLRGPKLEARLKELLGEPAEKPAAEKPAAEKPAEKKEKADEKPAEEKSASAKSDEKAAEEKPAAGKAEEAKKEEPKKEEGGGGCGAVVEEEKKEAAEDEKTNPYSARPGLSTDKLVAYIEKMLDKPKSIQSRAGFTEALVEACDRVLAANPAAKDPEVLTAAEAKFETLHKKACTGDGTCDKALVAFTDQMKADARPRIARQVAFFQRERKVLDGAELPADKIPDLLKELKDYYAAEKLTTKHLRMASSTVALINKLESGDEREKLFAEFGGLFAKASDKELARYGKKIAQKPEVEESELVGKDLDLAGTTAAGNAFKWSDYRGKVVLVDFWATWCDPCIKSMPHVKALHEKLGAKGFAVVGVSLDKDQEALQAFLAENQIPWENLAGEETQDLAEKFGIRGIPTMMAIGKDGKVLGVSHGLAGLVPLIEKALAAK